MSKTLFAQVQYDLNGLMSAVRMGQIGLPEIHPPSPLEGEDRGKETGIPFPPFKWDQDRRAILRAEVDAYYAQLYGLTEEELRYILDSKDIHGQDFPSETFRVLKEKETCLYGEYRTKRLVLEAMKESN